MGSGTAEPWSEGPLLVSRKRGMWAAGVPCKSLSRVALIVPMPACACMHGRACNACTLGHGPWAMGPGPWALGPGPCVSLWAVP